MFVLAACFPPLIHVSFFSLPLHFIPTPSPSLSLLASNSLSFFSTRDDINKSYRRLAALVHPDKCKAPGAEEAFKALTQARNNLLKLSTETTV